jgi:hypothetical protein
MGANFEIGKLADIKYHGIPSYTLRCIDALVNLLSAQEEIESAWFL